MTRNISRRFAAAIAVFAVPLALASAPQAIAGPAPTVDERLFTGEEVFDIGLHDGVEFTVNSPDTAPGDIFTWVVFRQDLLFAESTNQWGYQTIGSFAEWNQAMTSDGFAPGNDLMSTPISWNDLFLDFSSDVEALFNQGFIALGWFIGFGFAGNDADFTIGGQMFDIPTIAGPLLIQPGESQNGFFGLNFAILASPTAFALTPGQNTGAPITFFSNDQTNDAPAPAAIWMLIAGLLMLSLLRAAPLTRRSARD